MKRKKIFLTFIIKQNLHYYLMQWLKAILLAHNQSHPVGDWVVMKSAYAWTNNLQSFLFPLVVKQRDMSRCTSQAMKIILGMLKPKSILDQPLLIWIISLECIPLINKHNKACKNVLTLEKCWLTQDCWFCLKPTFFTDMGVVDLQPWDYSKCWAQTFDAELLETMMMVRTMNTSRSGRWQTWFQKVWLVQGWNFVKPRESILLCFRAKLGSDQ